MKLFYSNSLQIHTVKSHNNYNSINNQSSTIIIGPFPPLLPLTSRFVIVIPLQPKLLALCVTGMDGFMRQQLLTLDLILHTLGDIGHQVGQESRYYEDEMLRGNMRGNTINEVLGLNVACILLTYTAKPYYHYS